MNKGLHELGMVGNYIGRGEGISEKLFRTINWSDGAAQNERGDMLQMNGWCVIERHNRSYLNAYCIQRNIAVMFWGKTCVKVCYMI